MAIEMPAQKNGSEDMKIGILTFHRAHNYGAVLQCYALQEILKGMGHEVVVVDYRQPWIEEFYRYFSFRMLALRSSEPGGASAYVRNCLKKFIWSPCRRSYFRKFTHKYLNLTASCTSSLPQDLDCYVIGSDQLWSLHCLGGSFDKVYLGDFTRPQGSRLVGYAISADVRSVEMLVGQKPGSVETFHALSMREEKIADMVSAIYGRECPSCLDPTLLTDASLWEPVTDTKWKDRRYVLVYEVRWNKETKGRLRRKAEELAARIGDCEVIDLTGMKYSVTDFVSLFRYARYVVTTSFHGIVFSILFETPFYALPLWDTYDLRYRELLDALGAGDRFVSPEAVLQPQDMDFRHIKEALNRLRAGSLEFLQNSLSA